MEAPRGGALPSGCNQQSSCWWLGASDEETCSNSLVQMTRDPCLSHLPMFQLLPVLQTLEKVCKRPEQSIQLYSSCILPVASSLRKLLPLTASSLLMSVPTSLGVAHPSPCAVRQPFHFAAAPRRNKELWLFINFEETDILIVKSIPDYFG